MYCSRLFQGLCLQAAPVDRRQVVSSNVVTVHLPSEVERSSRLITLLPSVSAYRFKNGRKVFSPIHNARGARL